MESEGKAAQAERLCEEVAELARGYLNNPGSGGMRAIESRISDALADARWDDMSKWHRVKFRLMRMQRERASGAALRC